MGDHKANLPALCSMLSPHPRVHASREQTNEVNSVSELGLANARALHTVLAMPLPPSDVLSLTTYEPLGHQLNLP